MRKLTYFIACTVDGYIARADGPTRLELKDHKTFAGGVAIHHYDVVK